MAQYLWRIPNDYPSEWIGSYAKHNSMDSAIFRKAAPVLIEEGAVSIFHFPVSMKNLKPYDVLPNSTMIPLISNKVVSLLEALCPSEFQPIPATVIAEDGMLSGYWVLNVLVKVAAMDHSQSQFTFIPGTKAIMKVNRVKCKTDAMNSHHLARETDYMSFIWISEELHSCFLRNRVTGCWFILPDEVHP